MVPRDHNKGVFKRFLNGYYTNRAEKPDLPRSGLVQQGVFRGYMQTHRKQ